MGVLQRWFGGSAPARPAGRPAPHSLPGEQLSQQFPSSSSTLSGADTPHAVRKEVVRISMRDTLQQAGIPAAWLKSEPLSMAMPGRDVGIHVRLNLQHWDPRLVLHGPALQSALERRITALDPSASEWLMGFSWQFQVAPGAAPAELPPPASWSQAPTDPDAYARTVALKARPGGDADVITGPTRIAQASAGSPRQDLERMLAERDAEFQQSDHGFDQTQPMKL